jgi:threonine dehydratase
MMEPSVIKAAYARIKEKINHTPLLTCSLLNERLSAEIYFKFEGMQKVGAFKARGALNTILALQEKGQLPHSVVAYSSGNHAQAVAWAAHSLGIKATIVIPKTASPIKIAATRGYGADVVLAENRQEAETLAESYQSETCLLIPPYDHDDVISGQGTAVFEAWEDVRSQEGPETEYDAVFAPVGGGGLISGAFLATRCFSTDCQVYGAEPLIANDAARSYQTGSIQSFEVSPMTIADGTRTLHISERTFQYIKKLDGFYEISEENIIYWTQWLAHLLKINLEPTAALGMAAAFQWLKEQRQKESGNEIQNEKKKKILVMLSGGNTDPSTYCQIWAKNHLNDWPTL